MRNNKTESPLAKNPNLDCSHKAHERQKQSEKQKEKP